MLKKYGGQIPFQLLLLGRGQKRSRNLVVAFKLAEATSVEFDLADDQAENLFDITFCYFPITFRPPPRNPDAYG